jgi:hypothetical protein
MPDIYSRFIFDSGTGERWTEMTNAERQISAVNDGFVVWDGAAVNNDAPATLAKRPRIHVDAPAAIDGDYATGFSAFGTFPTGAGISAPVVLAAPANACNTLANAASVLGKIALIDRGTCSFYSKAQFAQAAGAVAAIIVNNTSGPAQLMQGPGGINIPVVSLSQTDGAALKAQLGAGVTATIAPHPTLLVGANGSGRVQLYAPNPLLGGSSISHWDVFTQPNLLMEPALNEDLSSNVDLTRAAFQDMGWIGGLGGPGGGGGGVPDPVVQVAANVPNPFGSARNGELSTNIPVFVERAAEISVSIHDLNGRLVKTLFQGLSAAGTHDETWNGTDEDGLAVNTGIYLVRILAGKNSASRRIAVVR